MTSEWVTAHQVSTPNNLLKFLLHLDPLLLIHYVQIWQSTAKIVQSAANILPKTLKRKPHPPQSSLVLSNANYDLNKPAC